MNSQTAANLLYVTNSASAAGFCLVDAYHVKLALGGHCRRCHSRSLRFLRAVLFKRNPPITRKKKKLPSPPLSSFLPSFLTFFSLFVPNLLRFEIFHSNEKKSKEIQKMENVENYSILMLTRFNRIGRHTPSFH